MMRSRIILAAILAFSVLIVNGQDSSAATQESTPPSEADIQSAQWSVNHAYRVYQASRSLNDLAAAKDALLNILVEVPGNDSILFELGTLYYQLKMYQSSALCANQVMAMDGKHLGAIEIAALSFENLGMNDKALENYEKLFLQTDDFNSLYKASILQFDLGRHVESAANIEILLGRKEADEVKIPLIVEGNLQKEYPMRALLLNLKGMNKRAQGDNAAAKTAFEASLKIAPDFISPKEQLAEVSK